MGFLEFVLILIIPALVGSATAVGWLVFKSADRALGDDTSADLEGQILDELDVLRVRVDAIVEFLDDPRLRSSTSDSDLAPGLRGEVGEEQGLGATEEEAP